MWGSTLTAAFNGTEYTLTLASLPWLPWAGLAALVCVPVALAAGTVRSRVSGVAFGWVAVGVSLFASCKRGMLFGGGAHTMGGAFGPAYDWAAAALSVGALALATGLCTALLASKWSARVAGVPGLVVGALAVALGLQTQQVLQSRHRRLPVFVSLAPPRVHAGFFHTLRAQLAWRGRTSWFGGRAPDVPIDEATALAAGWACERCSVDETPAAAGRLTWEARAHGAGGIRVRQTLVASVIEERGNGAWPLRVGARWTLRMVHNRGRTDGGWMLAVADRSARNLLPRDRGIDPTETTMQVSVVRAAVRDGLRRWTVEVAIGAERRTLEAYAVDGETFTSVGREERPLLRVNSQSASADGSYMCSVAGLPLHTCYDGRGAAAPAGPLGGQVSGTGIAGVLGSLFLGVVTLGGVMVGSGGSQYWCFEGFVAGSGDTLPVAPLALPEREPAATPLDTRWRPWWQCPVAATAPGEAGAAGSEAAWVSGRSRGRARTERR